MVWGSSACHFGVSNILFVYNSHFSKRNLLFCFIKVGYEQQIFSTAQNHHKSFSRPWSGLFVIPFQLKTNQTKPLAPFKLPEHSEMNLKSIGRSFWTYFLFNGQTCFFVEVIDYLRSCGPQNCRASPGVADPRIPCNSRSFYDEPDNMVCQSQHSFFKGFALPPTW